MKNFNLFRKGTACRGRNHLTRRLGVEPLERRELLSINLLGGELQMIGSGIADVGAVAFESVGNLTYVCARLNGEVRYFAPSQVQRITFYGEAGNDTFENNTDIPLLAVGGAGNDTLTGGGGRDTLYGDFANGGATDPSDDTLTAGNDVLYGRGGNDLIYGENGEDELHGCWGFDILFGGAHADVIFGGGDTDWLCGEGGEDWLFGDAGDDLLVGGADNDTYRYDADEAQGRDTIVDTSGSNWLDFTGTETAGVTVDLAIVGFQTCNANLSLQLCGSTINHVVGSDADDTIRGNAASNILIGCKGNDHLEGRGGNDWLYGFEGNDTYVFDCDSALGFDVIEDSAGVDTLDFSATTTRSITVSLATTAWQTVNSNLVLRLTSGSALENVVGGALGDSITGNAQSNVLNGGGGDDILHGGAGNDTLLGGSGRDTFYGDAGADIILALDGYVDTIYTDGRDTGWWDYLAPQDIILL